MKIKSVPNLLLLRQVGVVVRTTLQKVRGEKTAQDAAPGEEELFREIAVVVAEGVDDTAGERVERASMSELDGMTRGACRMRRDSPKSNGKPTNRQRGLAQSEGDRRDRPRRDVGPRRFYRPEAAVETHLSGTGGAAPRPRAHSRRTIFRVRERPTRRTPHLESTAPWTLSSPPNRVVRDLFRNISENFWKPRCLSWHSSR